MTGVAAERAVAANCTVDASAWRSNPRPAARITRAWLDPLPARRKSSASANRDHRADRTPAGTGDNRPVDTAPLPLLKAPVWTWEVPAYFFVGGAAGAAALIAAVAGLHDAGASIANHARWIAAVGGLVAPPLLIADLGRPARFLHMLRVFKVRSPMSVGAWTLPVFSAAAVISVGAHALSGAAPWLAVLGQAAGAVSALTGLVLATYTGVLLGVTAIPVWAAHVRLLPLLFGLSGLGAAVSLVELLGDRTRALNGLGLGVAIIETAFLVVLEERGELARRPLHEAGAGTLIRSSGVLSGPVALVIRLASLWAPGVRLLASVAMIVGSALTRVGWIAAGRLSAHDQESALR
jgi:formate-dependent nitrite reductase membrane component NrfD